MTTRDNALEIAFPLRGEWTASTTPADRIPSHGTHRMGLTYAFDFMQFGTKQNSNLPFEGNVWRYLFFGIPIRKCYCWGEEIYAPLDGEVVFVEDGHRERRISHWLVESVLAMKNALFFNENKHSYAKIAGNYVIIKCSENVYMAFVHLQTNSIKVQEKQQIKKGDLIGNVGHSGNSTSPHLHFQVMDREDIRNAKGLPCVFEELEVYQSGEWVRKTHYLPSKIDRIRHISKDMADTKDL